MSGALKKKNYNLKSPDTIWLEHPAAVFKEKEKKKKLSLRVMWSYFGDLLRREELPNSSSCNLPCRKLRDVEKGVKKLLCALGHQKGSV